MRKALNFPILVLAIALAFFVPALTRNIQAQTGSSSPHLAAPSANSNRTSLTATQIAGSLASLPEADLLIYLNPQRIVNEVVPKFLPAKDVEEMRKAFDDVKKNVGVDPTKVDYIVLAVRFKKPTDDLNFQAPEFMLLASGDFSAESLMVLARMAADGKLRDEKYGTRTLGLMTIDPLVKEAEKNPMLKALTVMGIVSINANTIAVGTPAYLKAAADASDGKDRISAATLNSLVRDTNALASVAGTPWHSFSKSFGMLGTETNARAARCESNIGNLYAAITMDATNFMVRGVMNADNPDTAKIFSNLYSGILRYAATSIPDPSAQTMLKGLAITAEGDEVMLRADFPQQMVVEMLKQQLTPKQDEAAKAVVEPPKVRVKAGVKKRTTRRRG
ncbi:MAG TPA: hypothetical protein VMS31_22020 [Pyrinomonadaceae bacterium]|nr:hypothetical protein [Pyrinomonadaceae bacterium]